MTEPVHYLARIDSFTPQQLDALPFGAIQLDGDGTILQFNEYEANLSNRRAPETIGRNFFRDVAPCTNVREFYGRFQEGVARGALNVSFEYRFAFRPAPRDVRVTLFYSAPTTTVWVFVQDRSTR
ncbi:MAG TPA: PAS domain-containing protein [Thermoanaerobaculia bacterium]|nr:PAS domain-containing protein [Thermoanaerobaculia bacterium]